jgi:hypothetical protein
MYLKSPALVIGFSFLILFAKSRQLVALTPPMGWNSWSLFGEEGSEKLVREMANAMVRSGWGNWVFYLDAVLLTCGDVTGNQGLRFRRKNFCKMGN